MKYHILNGDALAEKFQQTEIPGTVIVISEAFIEGPLSTEYTDAFWHKRAAFVESTYEADEDQYIEQFGSQLQLLDSIQDDDEIWLWFEDDLFCQANMWFAIHYISSRARPKFYRVFPTQDNVHWSGFGRSTPDDLHNLFNESVELSEEDIDLSNRIWNAYVNKESKELAQLSKIVSKGFRFLPEVMEAHLDRSVTEGNYGRPERSLIEILHQGKTNFYEICDAFWEKNSIYGFGDLQVLHMLKEMKIDFSDDPDDNLLS